MAKHKDTTNKGSTKKLKQDVKKRQADPQRPKTKENGTKKVARNIKPRCQSSKKANDASEKRMSKYFQVSGSLKEEADDKSNISEDVNRTFPESTVVDDKMEEEKEREKEEKDGSEESDEDEEWEEVEELTAPLGPENTESEPTLPSQPVEIEIETTEAMHKRQRKEKRQADFETYLRRMMKRFNKELLEDTHKVHLLCLLASGLFRNRLCCEPDLLAITLSLVPAHFTMVATERINTGFLEGLLKWLRVTFTLNPTLPEDGGVELREVLERRLGSLSVRDHQEMTYVFLLVLRSLRVFCRLVLSLQPLPFKPPTKKDKAQTSSGSPAKDKSDKPDEKTPEPKVSPGSKRPSSANSEGKIARGGKRQKKKEEGSRNIDREEAMGGQRPKNTKRRSVASKVSYKEESSEGEGPSEGEEFQLSDEDESNDSEGGVKKSSKSKAKRKGKGRAPRRLSRSQKTTTREERDKGEGEQETIKEGGRRREGKGKDEWIEVYLLGSKNWVCVDVDQGVGKQQLCTNQATHPITYVVGIDGDGYLKDLSSRYDPTWLTLSRRRRIDSEWWEETLEFYECPDSEREQKEDKEMQDKLLEKPLPTAVSEYKNHPLYVLERHLLKYEAVFPRSAAVLGYYHDETVYSRDCVHTLHSRDTWLKEARTVRLGEEPYKVGGTPICLQCIFKMVKGFSNRARKARMMSEQKDVNDLALFGHWQTEEYQPPVAIDGKVPRNDFGNVYMFKPCMVPVGCVHVRLPNLHRVARKLNLDCAAAVTGFDVHGGYSHAVTDGYIVCEEHEDILKTAWENEQEIQLKKEQEKREKRALANWTLLVKSLLIKERLQRRYGQQGLAKMVGLKQQEEGGVGGLSSGEEDEGGAQDAPPTLAVSWPQNRQQEQQEGEAKKCLSNREKRGQQNHLFPFEKGL